jgi:hypothetical protein
MLAFLAANGYTDIREIPGQGLCGLQKFVFTWGLVVDLSEESYGLRYCFETEAAARAALLAWDGQGHPGGPWIKCKGAGVDLLNPSLCDLDFG